MNRFVKYAIVFFLTQFAFMPLAFCVKEELTPGILKTLTLPAGKDYKLHICTDEHYGKLEEPFRQLSSYTPLSYKKLPMIEETSPKLKTAALLPQGAAATIELKTAHQEAFVFSPNIVDCVGICAKNENFLYVAHLDDASILGALEEFHSTFKKQCDFLPESTKISLISSHLTPKLDLVLKAFSDFPDIQIDIGRSYVGADKKNTYIPFSSVQEHCKYTVKSLQKVKPSLAMSLILQKRKILNIYSPRTILMNAAGDFFQIDTEEPWNDSKIVAQLKNATN